MTVMSESLRINMNKQGRITVPAEFRKKLNLQANSPLVIRIEDNKLIIQDQEQLVKEMMGFFREQNKLHKPKDLTMVDEFIAERRREAQKECLS